jgi:hypothetical protein
MSFRKVMVTLASCDACGPDWWHSTADSAPRLPSNHAAARRRLAEEYGWRIERLSTGRHLMFCPSCAVRSDCDLYGHDWPTDLGSGRLQACHRCNRVRRDLTPPPGHPEALPEQLPGWLAALDTELFGSPPGRTDGPGRSPRAR